MSVLFGVLSHRSPGVFARSRIYRRRVRAGRQGSDGRCPCEFLLSRKSRDARTIAELDGDRDRRAGLDDLGLKRVDHLRAGVAVVPRGPRDLALRRAHLDQRVVRAYLSDERLRRAVEGAVVADLVDVHVERTLVVRKGRSGVLLEQAPDRLLLEVAGDQHGGVAEVDAQDDGVVVRVHVDLRCHGPGSAERGGR